MSSPSDRDSSNGNALSNLLLFFASCAIAIVILYAVKPKTDIDFDQAAAVGADTIDYYARNGDFPVHCADARDIQNCLSGWRARGNKKVALWLGNSQLHAINQLKASEVSSTQLLHDSLLVNDWDLLTLSQPNANLQEHYALFEYMLQHSQVGALVLPVVFDDTREDGLREHVLSLAIQPEVKSRLAKTQLGHRLTADVDQSTTQQKDNSQRSWQDRSEVALNQLLARVVPLWGQRAELRSSAIFGLYRLRNTLFGISASTKRKVLPGPYANNLAALDAILSRASEEQIPALVYVAPIRNDVELPYVKAQYVDFIKSVEEKALANNALFVDLQQLIESSHWGRTGSINVAGTNAAGIDFMHFTAPGHKTLSDELFRLFNDFTAGAGAQ